MGTCAFKVLTAAHVPLQPSTSDGPSMPANLEMHSGRSVAFANRQDEAAMHRSSLNLMLCTMLTISHPTHGSNAKRPGQLLALHALRLCSSIHLFPPHWYQAYFAGTGCL